MRVCPRCGYRDISGWRQNRWRTDVDFMHWEEFKPLYPKISRSLQNGHPLATDKYYAYRLSGKKHKVVERILLTLYKVAGLKAWHIPREHVDHTEDIYQEKLFEGDANTK